MVEASLLVKLIVAKLAAGEAVGQDLVAVPECPDQVLIVGTASVADFSRYHAQAAFNLGHEVAHEDGEGVSKWQKRSA